MQNSNKTDFTKNPKLIAFDNLVRECFSQDGNHSRVLTEKGNQNNNELEGVAYCPRTFDGFTCWDETPASATAVQPCPRFVIGFDPRRLAFKTCTENGTWFKHPKWNRPWTNYTTCVDVEDLNFRNLIQNVYVSGYSVSLAALIISLFIFFYFRSPHYQHRIIHNHKQKWALQSLQCTRIRIHMHLFASFALNNVFWIVWYYAVVNRPDVLQANKDWCQALHLMMHYFMVSSYLWMFCEGLHLHIALVVVFVKDQVALRWFMAIGWGLSLIIVAVYGIVRYNIPEATLRCWIEHSDAIWIINAPVVASLLASFVFLVNVVRVLLTKLHPAPNHHTVQATKKAARATLILIPLFGLHFALIPLRPSPDSAFANFHQIISALLTSLQGACVAVLFCFTNHDVATAVRAALAQLFRVDDAGAGVLMTGATGGESLMNTRDNVV